MPRIRTGRWHIQIDEVEGNMPRIRGFEDLQGTDVTLLLEGEKEVKGHLSKRGLSNDDAEGHGGLTVEVPENVDLEGKRVTVRLESGDEVIGHAALKRG